MLIKLYPGSIVAKALFFLVRNYSNTYLLIKWVRSSGVNKPNNALIPLYYFFVIYIVRKMIMIESIDENNQLFFY